MSISKGWSRIWSCITFVVNPYSFRHTGDSGGPTQQAEGNITLPRPCSALVAQTDKSPKITCIKQEGVCLVQKYTTTQDHKSVRPTVKAVFFSWGLMTYCLGWFILGSSIQVNSFSTLLLIGGSPKKKHCSRTIYSKL